MGLSDNGLYVISVHGRDRPGLIRDIVGPLAKADVNIVDLEQSVLQGLFIMFMLVDTRESNRPLEDLREDLISMGPELGVEIGFTPMEDYQLTRKGGKELYVVTVLARDRVGIVYDAASLFAARDINIEKMSLTARGDLISIEFIVDLSGHERAEIREYIRRGGEEVGLDMIVQERDTWDKEKRLIVFDMDSTIVDFEIIDKLASEAGVGDEVEEITRRAMNGEIEFEEALRQRVRLLEGMPVEMLEEIAEELVLTPGSAELINHLKRLGYKIALISGGFTYFTDVLKERLGFDYTFANRLEIKDGRLTGEIEGRIIDAEAKGRIILELAKREGIEPENIVAVGDGANDRLMLQNAGLGVAFNAKEILKKTSDGTLSRDNLVGLLNLLGLSDIDRSELE